MVLNVFFKESIFENGERGVRGRKIKWEGSKNLRGDKDLEVISRWIKSLK